MPITRRSPGPGDIPTQTGHKACYDPFAQYVTCTENTVIVTSMLPQSLAHKLTREAGFEGLTLSTSITGTAQISPTLPTPDPSLSASDTLSKSSSPSSTSLGSPQDSSSSPPLPPPNTPLPAPASLSLTSPSSSSNPTSPASSSYNAPGSSVDSTATSISSKFSPSPLPTLTMTSATSSQSSTTFIPPPPSPSPPPPQQQQALATSHHSSKAGPIAGGIIGGLFLISLLFLWLYKKRILNRIRGKHRVAPSAEFLHPARALGRREGAAGGGLEPHQRGMSIYEGSRATSPYIVQRLGSSLSMHRDEGGVVVGMAGVGAGLTAVAEGSVPPDEPPPPFTQGNFTDPLVEKLNDAERQRQELYRAAASYGFISSQQDLDRSLEHPSSPMALAMPMPYVVDASVEDSNSSTSHARQDSDMTRMSQRMLISSGSHAEPFHESDSEDDMKNTSPMLRLSKASWMSAQVEENRGSLMRMGSQVGEIGWAV
ncbi:hypothetical protein BDY19DRAFT_989557 [Irpex rosettiformis]|uniref:Uncharacterized protein n=1 Tax=Irpex rosettiformis TaxID=378272 RepID=A0ACB8UIB7_9APHY|nr:hypothetical protein BDY19DRAFT_989557 [Irpex rosettiformis]